MNTNSFRLIIGCKLNGEDEVFFSLDTCKDKNVTSTNQIATYPLQNGNSMSDHMWRLPTTFSVSGTCSLYGNSFSDFTIEEFGDVDKELDLSGNRLSRIQNTLEYIKDNGILCDLRTVQNGEANGETQFKIRNNMAITSVRFNENQASMTYTIDFKEVIVSSVINYDTSNLSDGEFPYIYELDSVTLGQVMSDGTSEVYTLMESFLKYLIKNERIKNIYFKLEDGNEVAIVSKSFTKETNREFTINWFVDYFYSDSSPATKEFIDRYVEGINDIKIYTLSSNEEDNYNRICRINIGGKSYDVKCVKNNGTFKFNIDDDSITIANDCAYIRSFNKISSQTVWAYNDEYEVYLYNQYPNVSLNNLYYIKLIVINKASYKTFLTVKNRLFNQNNGGLLYFTYRNNNTYIMKYLMIDGEDTFTSINSINESTDEEWLNE